QRKLRVRKFTGTSALKWAGWAIALPSKVTNAAESLGVTPPLHLNDSDHPPSPSKFHDVPGGGVTCAQLRSTRRSSTCTFGTLALPCRSRNPATDGVPLSRSVPTSGADRIGDEGVDVVGAASAPNAVGLI